MGNILKLFQGEDDGGGVPVPPASRSQQPPLGPHGVTPAPVRVAPMASPQPPSGSMVPEGLRQHVTSSRKAQVKLPHYQPAASQQQPPPGLHGVAALQVQHGLLNSKATSMVTSKVTILRKLKKIQGVVDYYAKVKKDDHTLSSWALNYLESGIFSWSLEDVLNKKLLKGKVEKIPETFASLENYMDSFTYPLMEEAHADVLDSLTGYRHASFIEVTLMQKLDDSMFCFEVAEAEKKGKSREIYTPTKDDLIVVSSRKPEDLSDLSRNGASYVLGVIRKGGEDDEQLPANCFIVRLSSALAVDADAETKIPLFAVFLINMNTYNRIWTCLQLPRENGNLVKLRNKGNNASDLVHAVWRYRKPTKPRPNYRP